MYAQPLSRPPSTNNSLPPSVPTSPRTSPTSSVNSFPPIPAPCRQLHQPKSPLYRPAVLRAIDHASRPGTATSSPSTSPKSLAESFSALRGESGCAWDEFEDAIGDDICEEEEGKVTGPPRRSHWKPDSEARICDSPRCVREFSFYNRRHHCRRCGNVFCGQHSYRFLPLNQNGRVHPQGISSRVCISCYGDYKRIRAARRTESISSSSTSSTISSASPNTPREGLSIRPVNPVKGPDGTTGLVGKLGSYVGSVPRDWSWSTF